MMDKALGMLGLCARAGKLKSGESACEQAIKHGQSDLLLVDAGASARSKKALHDACEYAGATLIEIPEGQMGHAIGKDGRMAACITDPGFAQRIIALLSESATTHKEDTQRRGN